MGNGHRKNPRRILVGPSEIAGTYTSLVGGFRANGVQADLVELHGRHPFSYKRMNSYPALLARRDVLLEIARGSPLLVGIFLRRLARLLLFSWFALSLFRYDAFIYSFGRTFLPSGIDLLILRLLRKRVICNISHGSEARPPYMDGSYNSAGGSPPPVEQIREYTDRNVNQVRRAERYATWVIGAPISTAPFATRSFINRLNIGSPFHSACDASYPQNQIGKPAKSHVVRILHSPSHEYVKGTPEIRQVIEELRREGLIFETVFLQGVSNSKVLAEIESADIVVDQLFSDLPLSRFGLEASGMGKPVVVGGHYFDLLKEHVDSTMWPPIVYCRPANFKESLRKLILEPELRERLGRDAKAFVQSQLSSEKVALRYQRIFQGDIPSNWLLDPQEVGFLGSIGLRESELRLGASRMLDAFGQDSLRLNHRPDLLAKITSGEV